MASTKPENVFIGAVNKKLLGRVYFEKMHNPYRGGTPDVWYSGGLSDLWVEYKFIPKIPRTKAIIPDLTPLQRQWLRDRHLDGRNVAVILGVGRDGGVIYREGEWDVPLTSDQLTARIVSRAEIAQWITSQTGASACRCPPQLSSKPPK